MKDEFEEWAKTKNIDLTTRDNVYVWQSTQARYEAFRAGFLYRLTHNHKELHNAASKDN